MRTSGRYFEGELDGSVAFRAATYLSPPLAGIRRRGTITKSPSRCFRISTFARCGSPRSNASSPSSLVMTHVGCTRGGGTADAFSMVAHSARSPSSFASIARSSARTAGESPLWRGTGAGGWFGSRGAGSHSSARRPSWCVLHSPSSSASGPDGINAFGLCRMPQEADRPARRSACLQMLRGSLSSPCNSTSAFEGE